jgi:hypothetical protein
MHTSQTSMSEFTYDNVRSSSSDPLLLTKGMEEPQSLKDAEGLTRIGCICGGIIDDYKRRIPHYKTDITMAYTRKTISSALFMFFATFASTVALGVVIKRNTQCDSDMEAKGYCFSNDSSAYLGVTEYLVMNSMAGVCMRCVCVQMCVCCHVSHYCSTCGCQECYTRRLAVSHY